MQRGLDAPIEFVCCGTSNDSYAVYSPRYILLYILLHAYSERASATASAGNSLNSATVVQSCCPPNGSDEACAVLYTFCLHAVQSVHE